MEKPEACYYPYNGPIPVEFVQYMQKLHGDKPILILQSSSQGVLWNDPYAEIPEQNIKPAPPISD